MRTHRAKNAFIVCLSALSALLARSDDSGADDPDQVVVRPDLMGAIETDKPVRPWELPPDTIPDLRPQPRSKGEPASATSKSVSRAPRPERASGIAVEERESAANRWRIVPRVLLLIPRVAVEMVDAPVRGTLWTFDRFEIGARARDVFFNDSGTMGLYPVAELESNFGLTAGARFIYRNIFGEREKLTMRASFGGRYSQQYMGFLSTGERLGKRLRLEAQAEYEIDPREHFFGIGNSDEVDLVVAPVDPYADPASVDTRFRQRVGRVFGMARVNLFGPVSTRVTTGVLWKRFEESSSGEGTGIQEQYLTTELPAFEDGTSYSYNEIELRYDSRRQANAWERQSVPSVGWFIVGYGGLARSFARAPTRYVRYGSDVQRYLRLGESPRVLVLRAMAEEVRGDQEEIPFSDLPRLGGPLLLRGYERNRFRDRAMALASAEYQFDMGPMVAGFLFVDGGRVFPTLADITIEDIRVGYGGGLQLHTMKSFLGRLNVASSVDGGIFFNLNFDPVYDPRARVERD